MKRLFLSLSIPAFFIQAAAAQEMRPSFKDSLQRISDRMYEKGSAYFIIVDAFKDGILKPSTPFEFSYQDSTVRFSEIKLPEKIQREYAAKFQRYLLAQDVPANISASWRSDSVSTIQIFDTGSRIWSPTMEEDRKMQNTHIK